MITTIKQRAFKSPLLEDCLRLLESHVRDRINRMPARMRKWVYSYIGHAQEATPVSKLAEKNKKATPKAKAVHQFNYDLERMRAAVEAPVEVMPRGLTREQKRRFLMGEDH